MDITLLMTSDAAKILRRSETAVRGYERTGKLAAMRTMNGHRLFRREDVERLARELAKKPSPDKGNEERLPAA